MVWIHTDRRDILPGSEHPATTWNPLYSGSCLIALVPRSEKSGVLDNRGWPRFLSHGLEEGGHATL